MAIKWLPLRPKTKPVEEKGPIEKAAEEKQKALDDVYEMQYGKRPAKKK